MQLGTSGPSLRDDLKVIEALDGVRGIAILAVLVGHFAPRPSVQTLVGYGDAGVVIFFCLSGFLITRILLYSAGQNPTLGRYLAVFYGRRALRIFPAYYLCLIVMWVLGLPGVAINAFRLFTYTANYIPGWPHQASLQSAAHLWSLSVEEQFYWLWPLLLFFVRGERLLGFMVALIFGTVALKLHNIATHPDYNVLYRMLPSWFDALGAGGLVAVAQSVPRFRASLDRLVRVIAVGSATAFLAATVWRFFHPVDPWYRGAELFGVCYFWSLIVATVSLIHVCAGRQSGRFSRILCNPFLTYTGKISYGMYLIHFFLPVLLFRAGAYAGGWWHSFLLVAATYGIATVSWFAFERPILNFKHRLGYDRAPTPSVAVEEALEVGAPRR